MLPLVTDFRQASARSSEISHTRRRRHYFSGFGIGANVTVYRARARMILDDLSARQPDGLSRVDAE